MPRPYCGGMYLRVFHDQNVFMSLWVAQSPRVHLTQCRHHHPIFRHAALPNRAPPQAQPRRCTFVPFTGVSLEGRFDMRYSIFDIRYLISHIPYPISVPSVGHAPLQNREQAIPTDQESKHPPLIHPPRLARATAVSPSPRVKPPQQVIAGRLNASTGEAELSCRVPSAR